MVLNLKHCRDGGVISSVVKTLTKKVGGLNRDDEDENLEESMKKVMRVAQPQILYIRLGHKNSGTNDIRCSRSL